MKIPCDTIARLAHVLPTDSDEIDDIFRTFRLDNGKIIATNRMLMAVESLPDKFDGVYHIRLTDADIAQCRTEAAYNSMLDVVVTPVMTVAKTSYGYSPAGDIGVRPAAATDFDQWYDRIVKPCATPSDVPRGAMIWRTDQIVALACSAPSGIIVFESVIDVETRAAVMRDINNPDWCGFFMPRLNDGLYHGAAALPGWLR
jgi:hypothetical protein